MSLAIEQGLLARFDRLLRRRGLVDLRHIADQLLGLKGVKHGRLVMSSARL